MLEKGSKVKIIHTDGGGDCYSTYAYIVAEIPKSNISKMLKKPIVQIKQKALFLACLGF